MAHSFKTSEDGVNAMCAALVGLLDAGSSNATISFYGGSIPANPAAADTGSPLATLDMSDPAFGAPSAGVATADSITTTAALLSGTATHFRCKDSDDNVVFQGTAGVAADDTDATFDNKVIVALGNVGVASMTVTVPSVKA